MTEKEKAEAGLLYDAAFDEAFLAGRLRSQELSFSYNALRPSQTAEREKLIRENFKRTGRKFLVEQPFRCDFWERVSVGENFYSNYNFVILAGNFVEIGDNVMFGPDCGLYAAGHPLNAHTRNQGLEYAWPIRVGNNVWVGGGVKIMGGVTIGDNAVIASGSIVTKDIPPGVLAGGNPCRVIREISEEDDERYRRGFKRDRL